MTSEEVKAELTKTPFVPIRVHMVSGKAVDVIMQSAATVLQNAVFVLKDASGKDDDAGYDVISLRNIERLAQIRTPAIKKTE